MYPKNKQFDCFYSDMQLSHDYLSTNSLKDNVSYQIIARNAYVGIWIEDLHGFLISRYTLGASAKLFCEYHWDYHERMLGTVKPLNIIEACPYDVSDYLNLDKSEQETVIKYLDNLEEAHPIIVGYNTLQDRQSAAIEYYQKLSERAQKPIVEPLYKKLK